MPPQEFLLVLFCLIDDDLHALNLGRRRRCGPSPRPSDAEVLTIELAGSFWKKDADRDLFCHFRAYQLNAATPGDYRGRGPR